MVGNVDIDCEVRCVRPEAVARAREILESHDTYSDMAMLFAALSDPTRTRIVHLLLHEEMCTCDLATVLGVSESAVSQHLRVLRSLRLVRPRRAGRIVFYTLDDKHVARLVQLGLSHLGHQEAADRLSLVTRSPDRR
ncbi:MAG TPA: metalloregulator ArsR/SmtB family transcription factor [Candidatus Dormibacteraeota bacterium]|jgi:DNA-binding transcriptional ArsR family regulator